MVVTLGALALAPTAMATWKPKNTPNVTGADTWSLSAVSCTRATSCLAVGDYSASGGGGLIAESRDRNTWSLESSPDVVGAADHLNDISCTSASACMAVGSYDDGTDTVTLAESWNGSGWTIETTPNPTGATSSDLSGISCASATSCIAVGESTSSGTTSALAESWNGSNWTIQTLPAPTGATTTTLHGISCTSTTACVAVGYSSNGSVESTLAERWNGSVWAVESTPSGNPSNRLEDVSCTAPHACTAVGDSGLAIRLDGTTWTLQSVPDPHGDTDPGPELESVSCTSATSCTAVGGFFDDAVLTRVAEAWDGTAWRIQDTPIFTSQDSSVLNDVSCHSPTACTAVGSLHNPILGDRALAEEFALRWQDGGADVPIAIASSLDDVSCPAATACAAIGGIETSSDFEPVAEIWNGRFWRTVNTPNPSNSNLSGVSCSSRKACTAVGDVVSGGSLVTLVERWDGTSWTVQSTPNPTGATQSFLLDVSCPSPTSCTAVGFYRAGGTEKTLAEHWNGTTWAIEHTPNPTGTSPELSDVSCTSASACQAVGEVNSGGFQTVAEGWNGTHWKLESAPLPAGGSSGVLSGVSCTAATACTAVGDYFNGSQEVTLAETWSGTSWTAAPAAVPTGKSSQLSGVSCLSTSWCEGTGSYVHGPNFHTLAEHWDGLTWTVQTTPRPSGELRSALPSISCPSIVNCTAVGWFDDGSGNESVLADLYS